MYLGSKGSRRLKCDVRKVSKRDDALCVDEVLNGYIYLMGTSAVGVF